MAGLQKSSTLPLKNLAATAAGVLLVLVPLASRALWDPDEGRYAEIAREMLALKDWIVPHLDYLPYLEKPPLGYWLSAISLAIFGLREWAARLPCALAGFATAGMTWYFGRTWAGRRTAWLSVGILASSLQFYIFTQFLVLDMVFTFFFTTTLWLFWFGLHEEGRRSWLWVGAGLTAGLATLTKGPIGLVLPGLIALIFLAYEGKLSQLLHPCVPVSLLVALLVPLPWFVAMRNRVPGFLGFFFFRENAFRFLTVLHERTGSFLYYVPVLAAGFLPWTALVPLSIRTRRNLDEGDRFLLTWFVAVFLFFSLAGSKLVTYILPAYPALALLGGRFLEDQKDFLSAKMCSLNLWIWNGLLVAVLILVSLVHFPSIARELLWASIPSYAMLIVTPLIGAVFLLQGNRARAFVSVVLGTLLFEAFLSFSMRRIEPFLTTRSLAGEISRRAAPGDAVISFDANLQESLSVGGKRPENSEKFLILVREWLRHFGGGHKPEDSTGEPLDPMSRSRSFAPTYERRLQSLPFYLRRQVIIVGRLGELKPGAQLEPSSGSFMTHEQLRDLLKSRNVFGVCKAIHLPVAQLYAPLEILDQQADLVLFRNHLTKS